MVTLQRFQQLTCLLRQTMLVWLLSCKIYCHWISLHCQVLFCHYGYSMSLYLLYILPYINTFCTKEQSLLSQSSLARCFVAHNSYKNLYCKQSYWHKSVWPHENTKALVMYHPLNLQAHFIYELKTLQFNRFQYNESFKI